MSLVELKESAAQLADSDKGALAAWLLNLLPPHGNEDASADSLQEAVCRRDELDSGSVKPMSADEFWAAVERERTSWK